MRAFWAGPAPHRLPQFWLQLGSRSATEQLPPAPGPILGQESSAGFMARCRSRWIAAPQCVVARVPDGEGPEQKELLLLTGGGRTINKVVALEFGAGSREPAHAIKFARVREAEPGLEREAEVLSHLTESRPNLAGYPRFKEEILRCGMVGVAESPIEGEPLIDALSPASFGDLAERVTDLLVELAGEEERRPESTWRARLVDGPLERFERQFGQALAPGAVERVRGALGPFGDLPIVSEHRDCSPWNIVIGAGGTPALLDWESAEPEGLPGLDLVYFLANSAFILDGALEAGTTRGSYAALLDPATAHGRVAAECLSR